MKFRSKIVDVEAVQFTGQPHPDVSFGTPEPEKFPHLVGKHWCGTLEGPHEVTIGDWIITGLKGEKYPVKPDIMEMKYTRVSGTQSPRHPAVQSVLQFFTFSHLPPHLAEVSQPFAHLANAIADGPQNAEATVALRKLLEAKDAAVRAVLFK